MELARQAEDLRKRGLGVAAIVPEPVEDLKRFAVKHGITYPLLSDRDSAIIDRFGVADLRFKKQAATDPDIPYAGNFLLDARGIVRAKFFEKDTEIRRTAGSILVLAGGPGTGGEEIRTDFFTLRTSASNAAIAPGQRFTLVLDFEMKPKHHAYAPGVRGYKPLELRLDPNPLFELQEVRYPEPLQYFFAPLKEKVPVFEGRFRLLQDVVQSFRQALSRFGDAPELTATITGTLRYQVCSDTVCYPPASLPVRWSVRIHRWVK